MDEKIAGIKSRFDTSLKNISTVRDLQQIKTEYLGRKGHINSLFATLKSVSKEELKRTATLLNDTKKYVEEKISIHENDFTQKSDRDVNSDVDVTIPGNKPKIGHLHPTTQFILDINSFFRYHGFSVYMGSEIVSEDVNFEKLNLPAEHPARDLQDTLYIDEDKVLLRTHTSSAEVEAMISEKLPLRIVVPGKVYRNETSNVTNNSMFYQYEGLVVDKGISMAHLKWMLEQFAQFLYGQDVKTRLRCKYYPQVEPGIGMDYQCTFCEGNGCDVCKQRGWIEVLGAGMVHPKVLSSCGIDTDIWSGFAFGLGLDRLVMLRNGITDIRKLYSGELIVA